MELVKDYKILIENLVKANPKYSGNEDLLEDFCSETYQKSYLILQSVDNEESLKTYLRKVVSSAIVDVLKNSGRLIRSVKGYKSVKEVTIGVKNQDLGEEISSSENIVLDNADSENNTIIAEEYDNNKHLMINIPPSISSDLTNIKDPKESIEEQIIRKDIIENIINKVEQINVEKPGEMYLKIFYMRYFLNKKQKDIADEIGISQSEISKRLVQLSRLIKEKLY